MVVEAGVNKVCEGFSERLCGFDAGFRVVRN